MARASRTPVTALYVTPPGGKRRSAMVDALLKDIVALGESYGVEAKTAVRTKSSRPGDPQGDGEAKTQPDRDGRRAPAWREALLRRHRDAILEKSDRSIVFVVS